MNKIIYKLLMVLLLSSISVNTYALNNVTSMSVLGCGTWVKYQSNTEKYLWEGEASRMWVVGFVNGMAAYSGKDVLNNVNEESITLWITNYCEANPLKDTDDAAYALFHALRKEKGIK